MKIKINEDKYCGHQISISHNGYQWTTINMGDNLSQVIDVQNSLIEYVEKLKKEGK